MKKKRLTCDTHRHFEFGDIRAYIHAEKEIPFYKLRAAYKRNPEEYERVWIPYMESFKDLWESYERVVGTPYTLREHLEVLPFCKVFLEPIVSDIGNNLEKKEAFYKIFFDREGEGTFQVTDILFWLLLYEGKHKYPGTVLLKEKQSGEIFMSLQINKLPPINYILECYKSAQEIRSWLSSSILIDDTSFVPEDGKYDIWEACYTLECSFEDCKEPEERGNIFSFVDEILNP